MKEESIIQNLIDAGCPKKRVDDFMNQRKNGNIAGQLHILNKQRASLLNEVHKYYERIDCLDYLIYKINDNDKGEHNE